MNRQLLCLVCSVASSLKAFYNRDSPLIASFKSSSNFFDLDVDGGVPGGLSWPWRGTDD